MPNIRIISPLALVLALAGIAFSGGTQFAAAGIQRTDAASSKTSARAQTPESLFSARFERDRLGLEIERALPGGVQSTWQRDRLGRPLRHEISSFNQGRVRDSRYTWGPNDRLQAVVDSLRGGPVQYTHDAVGNLSAAKYKDGRIDLRMPDAVGNLFRVSSRTDRVYGPAGQLLESNDGHTGITRYTYDVEGNLLTKTEPAGGIWRYTWNAAGMLVKVVRPDGGEVGFAYDGLGRRAWKKYRGKTTRWVWDGNVPLHEWVERDNAAIADVNVAVPVSQASAIDAQIARRNAEIAVRPAQGPPRIPDAVQNAPISEGTRAEPITWLFEPESFAPLGRLVGKERHSIVTDHLGTPVSMHDTYGRLVWSADVGAWGQLRRLQGDRAAQPFRWPGQYEDVETGLYYNRFRYYDPDAGQYVSQDPIGLAGGTRVHG